MDSISIDLWESWWHPVCHRSEVANARDFVRLEACGEELVVFNDGSDVVVFDNLCPHRGARIFDGHSGNARFLCRYHGWSYAGGKIFTGARDDIVVTPGALCLRTYASAWVGDFLFASKRPKRDLADQLGDLWPVLERVSRSCAARADINAYTFEADWRIAIENALEPYHVGVIHGDSLDTLDLQPGTNRYSGANSVWETTLGNDRMARQLNRLAPMFDLQWQYQGYWSVFLFPFSMISSTWGYSYSQQNFFPSAEPEKSSFLSRLYSARLKPAVKPEVLAGFFASTSEMNRRVFEEDHAICKRVPFRAWSSEVPAIFLPSEEKIVRFREAYRDAVQAGAAS
ncbi:MAG TPA: Rieske 2Fe-2S domain-containing protein [Sphingomonas sp.]|nr:Rieske 2Fe-2S domain-containing protein [Sphingomonas sp.]